MAPAGCDGRGYLSVWLYESYRTLVVNYGPFFLLTHQGFDVDYVQLGLSLV